MSLKDRFKMTRQIIRTQKAMEAEEKLRRKQMKVYRTLEGTLFEVACGLILAATWCMAIIEALNGQDNENLILCAILTITAIGSLVCAYHPQWINSMNEKIENSRQLALLVRSVRMCALWLAIILFFIVISAMRGINLPQWTIQVLTVSIVIIPIYFTYKIKKAK